jgi:aspartyl-tRNA(Asn)/glutamyl-tRNA(Gln) amidotransferase subunit A
MTTALDRTNRCLAAIDAWNDTLRAMIAHVPQAARKAAGRSDDRAKQGQSALPLDGLVVSLKDNIATADIDTTSGSDFFRGYRPAEDATVVRRLRAAGAVIIGKVNLHEFAMGGTTQNPHYGSCRTPWDTDCIPGGSSGGSGSAVAAGMCEVSLGTDTGGSVRIPCSLNGVAGMRPTAGRISNAGVTPVSARFDTVGPMSRSVALVGDTYEVIAGYDPLDVFSQDRPVVGWRNAFARGSSGLRIGVPGLYFFDALDATVRALLDAALGVFRDLGCVVLPIELAGVDRCKPAMLRLIAADGAMVHRQRMQDSPERFGADLRSRLEDGAVVTGIDYAEAMLVHEDWKRQVDAVFDHVDIIFSPGVGFGAPKVADSAAMMATVSRLTQFISPWALAHVPVVSVPCGLLPGGLPTGFQLVGRQWTEDLLLAAGAAYQAVTDHHLLQPPALSVV